jgi:hypothetical protein
LAAVEEAVIAITAAGGASTAAAAAGAPGRGAVGSRHNGNGGLRRGGTANNAVGGLCKQQWYSPGAVIPKGFHLKMWACRAVTRRLPPLLLLLLVLPVALLLELLWCYHIS